MATYKDTCLALGPLVYVRLGETSGTVADDLGSLNLDGTYSGSYTQGIATDIGDGDTATQFTAAGSGQLAIPHDAALNLGSGTGTAWTLVFRVRVDGTPPAGFPGVMTKGGGTSGWLIYSNTDGTAMTFKLMGTQVSKTALLTVDTWAWIAISNNGAQLEWFKDGVSQGTTAFSTAHAPSGTGALTLNRGDGTTNFHNLTLDEFAVFDYQLTTQQIADLYASWGNAGTIGGAAAGTHAWAGSASGSNAPATPTGLTATPVSDSQIDLSWDAVASATAYDIERDSAVIVTGHSTNAYSDTGLAAGTTYTYRVRSVAAVGGGGSGTDPAFATLAQIASLSTTSGAALRAKAIADGVKNGTYVAGASVDTDIKDVNNRVGPIALTTALWWALTGDDTYLPTLKDFILAAPKPYDAAIQALNEFRAYGGLFAAVDILARAGQWDGTATMPTYGGTWDAFMSGLSTRVVSGTGRTEWRSLRGCAVDTANNWGGVARFAYLMWAVCMDDQAAIDEVVLLIRKFLGDQPVGVADFNTTADYRNSWDNWTTQADGGGRPLPAGIGQVDAVDPGLDGVVIEDIARGVTDYSSTADQYGATGGGITYPLENAAGVWPSAAVLRNLGYAPETWGSSGLARMSQRFNRVGSGSTLSQFETAEGMFSIYKNSRWFAAKIDGATYGTPQATSSGTGAMDRITTYGDWIAATSSLWGT